VGATNANKHFVFLLDFYLIFFFVFSGGAWWGIVPQILLKADIFIITEINDSGPRFPEMLNGCIRERGSIADTIKKKKGVGG